MGIGVGAMEAIKGIIDPINQVVIREKTKKVAVLKGMLENREITLEEYADEVQKLTLETVINQY